MRGAGAGWGVRGTRCSAAVQCRGRAATYSHVLRHPLPKSTAPDHGSLASATPSETRQCTPRAGPRHEFAHCDSQSSDHSWRQPTAARIQSRQFLPAFHALGHDCTRACAATTLRHLKAAEVAVSRDPPLRPHVRYHRSHSARSRIARQIPPRSCTEPRLHHSSFPSGKSETPGDGTYRRRHDTFPFLQTPKPATPIHAEMQSRFNSDHLGVMTAACTLTHKVGGQPPSQPHGPTSSVADHHVDGTAVDGVRRIFPPGHRRVGLRSGRRRPVRISARPVTRTEHQADRRGHRADPGRPSPST